MLSYIIAEVLGYVIAEGSINVLLLLEMVVSKLYLNWGLHTLFMLTGEDQK